MFARRTAPTADAKTAGTNDSLPWIALTVLCLDRWLRQRQGVFEYSADPLCVFRIQKGVADRNLVLADETIVSIGDPIITLHLWNEHVPKMAPVGPTLGWGCRLGYSFDYSLRLLSEHISRNPELSEVVAVRGDLIMTQHDSAQRIMRRHGFETVPGDDRTAWTKRVWNLLNNALGLLLCIAVNPPAARREMLQRGRSQVMLSRATLDRRYGTTATSTASE